MIFCFRYKAKNKLICLRQKVRNINALLCAIFNTRAKYLRMKVSVNNFIKRFLT